MESKGRQPRGPQNPKNVTVPKGGRNLGRKKKADAEVQKSDAEVQTDNDTLELSMELAKGFVHIIHNLNLKNFIMLKL
jgi:hypothetical protein